MRKIFIIAITLFVCANIQAFDFWGLFNKEEPKPTKEETLKIIKNNILYELDTINNIAIVKGPSNIEDYSETDVVLDSQIVTAVTSYPVTRIDSWAFSQCKYIERVILPCYLKKIGKYAFSKCENLEMIIFSESLENIDDGAFSECISLRSLTFDNNIKNLGTGTFQYCKKLSEIKLPTNLRKIPESCFNHCSSLKEIAIPSNVKSIEDRAFDSCSQLKKVTFLHNEFGKCSLESIGGYAFWECTQLVSCKVPKSVKHVGEYAFHQVNCDPYAGWSIEEYLRLDIEGKVNRY